MTTQTCFTGRTNQTVITITKHRNTKRVMVLYANGKSESHFYKIK